MKHQALYSSKDKDESEKKTKCHLLHQALYSSKDKDESEKKLSVICCNFCLAL